jgi:hypothetical protein
MAKHSLGVPGGLIALDFRRSGVCAAEIEENRPSTCGKDGFSSTQSAEAPKKGLSDLVGEASLALHMPAQMYGRSRDRNRFPDGKPPATAD